MMGLAFDMDPKKVGQDKDKAFLEYRRRRSEPKPVRMVPPSSAPVKEVVLKGKDIDLGLLPITKQAPLNSKKYIPVGQMVGKDPTTGIFNVGIYRHELQGRDKLGWYVAPMNNGAYIARSYKEIGRPMEVVIFIGHHPSTCLGATYSGNIDVNEFEVMGGYLGDSLEVTQAETVDLPVPARAEIAIEGIIDPNKMGTDGPYSEWSYYYCEERECYVIQVTAITMRRDAIYHDLDPCHFEHNFLGALGVQSNGYDAVKMVVPMVKSVYMPPSGRGRVTMYLSIKKRVPGEGKRAALAAVNSFFSTKIAVVVDDDIDVYNEEEVLWAVATRCCPDLDINIIPRMAAGILDPTSYDETHLKGGNMNSKIIIDATMPVELPFATRITPPKDLWERMKLEDYLKDYRKL
jgi:2,5-furandicarboxylate decarboxylase 1